MIFLRIGATLLILFLYTWGLVDVLSANGKISDTFYRKIEHIGINLITILLGIFLIIISIAFLYITWRGEI